MTNLKIPNLNNKSEKFFFKKGLKLRRKSKRTLIKESFIMLASSILIIYLINLIPEKQLVFDNFFLNFNKLLALFLELISYVYKIFLAIFILISLSFSVILIFGSLSRILKIIKRKSKQVTYK